jgi:hypothetical protein
MSELQYKFRNEAEIKLIAIVKTARAAQIKTNHKFFDKYQAS